MMRMVLRFLLALGLGWGLAACVTAPEPPGERRIALTFDDIPRGPGAFMSQDERADRLRAGLREAGVEQAAFFINTGGLERGGNGAAHIEGYVADGHVIANHTANHPSLSDIPLADYIADIDAAEAWLAGREGYRPWFRYPFLNEGRDDVERRDAVRAALAERGLINGYVTVDASDWFYEGAAVEAVRNGHEMDMVAFRDLYIESHVEAAAFFDDLARRALGRSPAHVMLMHETDIAALWLPELVAALEADGWTIITADEAFADPLGELASTYETPSAQGTLTEAVAWQLGLPQPRWYARNNIDQARAAFETRVLGREETP